MKYETDIIPVCDVCVTVDDVKSCERCGIQFCVHYASDTDVRYCGNCLDDFRVVETIEIKKVERLNENGDVTYTRRQVCKNLHLEGTDWLFAAAKISTLSDEQILATIEYHKAIQSLMLNERETRKIERYKKLAAIKTHFKVRDDVDSTGAIKQPKTRTTSVKSQKTDAEKMADALAMLLKSGLSRDQITQMLAKK